MAEVYDEIDAAVAAWIEQQPLRGLDEAPEGADHASATGRPAHRSGDVPPAMCV
jgi:hypothetical protein